MIRDVVTRGFSGQGDGLKYVVTRGYDIGAAVALAFGPLCIQAAAAFTPGPEAGALFLPGSVAGDCVTPGPVAGMADCGC